MAQDSFLEFYNRSDSKILISSFKKLRNKYYNKTAEKNFILYFCKTCFNIIISCPPNT